VSEQPQDIAQRLAPYLDRGAAVPVSRQIVEWVWLEVVTGGLDVGERLPTARQLAVDLGVNPRMVERAYGQLQRLGVLVQRPGTGTFVSVNPPSAEEHERHTRFAALCRESLEQAEALGFRIDEVIDSLIELRDARRDSPTAGSEIP
jgi:GntR family transcriptional regulator